MRSLHLMLAALLLSTTVAAAPAANDIAVMCKKAWPGQRGVQSFCIKTNRDYHDWISYLRKRTAAGSSKLQHLDECVADHYPDYRKAFDCIEEGPGLLPFL